jgi:hypothetical protein
MEGRPVQIASLVSLRDFISHNGSINHFPPNPRVFSCGMFVCCVLCVVCCVLYVVCCMRGRVILLVCLPAALLKRGELKFGLPCRASHNAG